MPLPIPFVPGAVHLVSKGGHLASKGGHLVNDSNGIDCCCDPCDTCPANMYFDISGIIKCPGCIGPLFNDNSLWYVKWTDASLDRTLCITGAACDWSGVLDAGEKLAHTYGQGASPCDPAVIDIHGDDPSFLFVELTFDPIGMTMTLSISLGLIAFGLGGNIEIFRSTVSVPNCTDPVVFTNEYTDCFIDAATDGDIDTAFPLGIAHGGTVTVTPGGC
jgi:hypothetical protein